MFKINLFVLLALILIGCGQDKHEWNPIVEETNFEYFTVNIERSLSFIEDANSEANKNKEAFIQEKLSQAKSRLLEIKDYYVPLTTVRQKIYDAERYFKLDDIQKTEKLLKDSKTIITSLDMTTKNEVFDKVILDLNAKINEVMISLDEASMYNTQNKIKILGEHVNLMLSRGDLVLSGIEFEK